MATFLCATKSNSNPQGKPRVYFTCHPEDFARYFDKIREDIFKTHDCAIYYTQDMTEVIADEDKATDLGQMNLFVVPVTFRLLSQPNRAMDDDIAYAKQQHVPILPLMMETGIDEFYEKPEKFGELQYLSPYSHDLSEISYADKLKKYLESVLISDEMAQRVREAFDAYIFLSYRKKDRRYANELMGLIHRVREFRDIAIWYDEFLTPGESFRQNIDKALSESKFFALLVTPSLLEMVDGKPNFVMKEEYPAAKRANMPILPAEMVQTDRDELRQKFDGIPDCADPTQQDEFRTRFMDALQKVAVSENDSDPLHNFLIGLAYLDGIDVEINCERALELITSAAENDLLEAMEKLYDMYSEGTGVQLNYSEAAKWAERIVEYNKKNFGEEDSKTLTAMSNLAARYCKLGKYQKTLELSEKAYILRCKTLGEEHPSTLTSLNNLAVTYGDLGKHQQALALKEKVYTLRCKILGEEHPDTLTSLNNLAMTYGDLGKHQQALELNEKAYTLCCKILGEEHPDTLCSLNNLAVTYGKIGKHQQALELNEKAYALHCKVLGEEHPDTLTSLNNLAVTYGKIGKHQQALELNEKAYTLRCQGLGEEHPDTLISLVNIAATYDELGNCKKALELKEKAYILQCKTLGEEHPHTLGSLSNLAYTYNQLWNHKKALELHKKVYELRCKVLGEKHPDTLTSLHFLAVTYEKLGNTKKARILMAQYRKSIS